MKNTLLVCALALSALSFPSFAQEGKEVEWYNVTALNFSQLAARTRATPCNSICFLTGRYTL